MGDAGDASITICYRCGKDEQDKQTFRLLPGSSHITLCPACYQVVWGWHEQAPSSASDGRQGKQQKGRSAPA